jgi:hypothetical protein
MIRKIKTGENDVANFLDLAEFRINRRHGAAMMCFNGRVFTSQGASKFQDYNNERNHTCKSVEEI